MSAALLATAAAIALLPGIAAASCMEPPPLHQHLAEADLVLVGTVVDLTNDNRTATVIVSEIWSVPDLPRTVTVHGGPDEAGMMTSVDRSYEHGAEYIGGSILAFRGRG